MTSTALSVTGLTKRYGARTAVDDLDIELPSGVVAGFVGPNGAGKTTTMAMLLGLVRPTAGTGTVLGAPLDRARRLPPPGRCAHREPGLLPGAVRAPRTCGCSPPSAGTTDGVDPRACSRPSASTAAGTTATAATRSG